MDDLFTFEWESDSYQLSLKIGQKIHEKHVRGEPAWNAFLPNGCTHLTANLSQMVVAINQVFTCNDTLVVRWRELYAPSRQERNETIALYGRCGLKVLCTITNGIRAVVSAYVPRPAIHLLDNVDRFDTGRRDIIRRYLPARPLPGYPHLYWFAEGENIEKPVSRTQCGATVPVVMSNLQFVDRTGWASDNSQGSYGLTTSRLPNSQGGHSVCVNDDETAPVQKHAGR